MFKGVKKMCEFPNNINKQIKNNIQTLLPVYNDEIEKLLNDISIKILKGFNSFLLILKYKILDGNNEILDNNIKLDFFNFL